MRTTIAAIVATLVSVAACAPAAEDTEYQVARHPASETEDPAPIPETPAPPPDDRLVWTGCDISKKAYITDAALEYTRQTGVEIVVTGGGATRGIRAAAGGTSDVGGTCRHALPDRFPDEEADAVLTHVAWDALVFLTHSSNPVTGISTMEAREILLGNIKNWKEVGGPDAPILPVFRQQTVSGKTSGVGYMTRLLLFGDPNIDYTGDAIFFASSGPVEEYVETTPFAFAVTGVSSARRRAAKMLALDGIQPDPSGIASGEYPLFRPLYLATNGPPSGASKDFVDWILGPEGQAVMERVGTVNLRQGAGLADRYEHWPEIGVVTAHPRAH